LPAILDGNGDAIEVTLVIESGIFDELRVLNVGLRLWRLGVELCEERCWAEFAEIREKNGACIRGQQRQNFFAGGTALRAPSPVTEKCG